MKEATGELNMTFITMSIVFAIFSGIAVIVPHVLDSAREVWGVEQKDNCVNFGMTDYDSCVPN